MPDPSERTGAPDQPDNETNASAKPGGEDVEAIRAADADAGFDEPNGNEMVRPADDKDRPSAAADAYEIRDAGDAEPDLAGLVPSPEGLDYDLLRQMPFLDDHYNETYLYLVPRDPESIFVVWEIGEATRVDLVGRFGDDFFDNNRLILRIHQVSGVDFDGHNANHVFEVDDDLHWKNNYWVSVLPGEHYVAELGYRAHGTTFFEFIARSNTVFTPKAGPTTEERYAEWSRVEVDGNDVEVEVRPEDWRFNQYRYWRERTHNAPDEKGCWALVLHQHLPFIRHPEYKVSLEEQWFFEAVATVYTQLLHMLWNLERDKVDFRLTVSLTPPLLSMMRDPLLKQRAARHIDECIALATRERDNSHGKPWHDTAEQILHRFWIAKEVFDAYEGDLTRGYRDFQDMGKLEVFTCPATHMLLPLFMHFPESIRAQVRIAADQYEDAFGRRPRGIWLPENAYTPGLDAHLAAEGIDWFLTSSVGMRQGDTRPFFDTHAPVITPSGVACFGIDEDTRQQVWSREAGYPGHVHYKEWYRDLGYDADWDYLPDYFKTANVRRNTGVKYYRITQKGADLGGKDYYNVAWAEAVAHEQAGQFVYYRGTQANHIRDTMGVRPCIVSAYDAELFGHWWEEGPLWIESVFRKMLYDQTEVRPVTPSEFLAESPEHQTLTPGASSWGKKNYFGTWVDGRAYQPNTWVYRHYYRLSGRMSDLAERYRDATDPTIRRALNQAARELCLAISSDWGFLIETGQAVGYSEQRIVTHIDRARELMRQIEAGEIVPRYLDTLEAADTIFAGDQMDYRVFCRA
ncbi:MAG: 1,4-alpha-glucan branching protein domain-containing protein [Planctomycetota bacterium]